MFDEYITRLASYDAPACVVDPLKQEETTDGPRNQRSDLHDHKLSSVGFTIANGGITAGLKVFIFLSSSGVDLVRKRAADTTQSIRLNPSLNSSTILWREGGQSGLARRALRAAATARVTSWMESSVMHEKIKAGAATLSF
jgi:predicted peroxiredoxin